MTYAACMSFLLSLGMILDKISCYDILYGMCGGIFGVKQDIQILIGRQKPSHDCGAFVLIKFAKRILIYSIAGTPGTGYPWGMYILSLKENGRGGEKFM